MADTDDVQTDEARAYSQSEIDELGKKGQAFKNPDGSYSYPIANVADLKNAMPTMREPALLYIARPLLQQAETNPALAEVLAELRQIPAFELAVEVSR